MAAETGTRTCFEVQRSDWRKTRFVSSPLETKLAPGQVRLQVDRFALTANNVSYALAGELLGYWRFFPAEEGWGRIPAMGFADVVASCHDGISEGARYFGFYPMATHLTVEAADVVPGHFMDAAAHRKDTAPAYRQYVRTTHDPLYRAEHEDALLLLRGLFLTSFLVDDFLDEKEGFGAESVLVSSASSKTAIALAFLLSRRGGRRVVGLTSARNRAFVEGLGCYDETLAYDEVASLPQERPTVLVDHSGDGAVLASVHGHFGDALRHSCSVGATHWDAGRAKDLPGPPPAFFFAPGQIVKRTKEWGPAGFQERLAGGWHAFRAFSEGWMRVVRGFGREAVAHVYGEILEGRARPEAGHVLSLWEGK